MITFLQTPDAKGWIDVSRITAVTIEQRPSGVVGVAHCDMHAVASLIIGQWPNVDEAQREILRWLSEAVRASAFPATAADEA